MRTTTRIYDQARTDLVASALGLLAIGGLYTDGWAHVNIGGLESFFTPWHAVLYGSFTVLVAWIAVSIWRRHQAASSWTDAIPPGYGLGLAGIVIFALGGILDMVWHTIFGVEVGVDALVSPTHLVLLTGAALLLSSPIRSALQATPRPDGTHPWAPVLGVASVAALAVFFLSYLSVFTDPLSTLPMTHIPEGAPGHQSAELPAVAGLGGYLVTTLLLVLPVDFLRRTGRLPAGSVFLVVAAVAVPAAALSEFTYVWPLVGALVAGALVDVIGRNWSRSILGPVMVGTVWAGQLTGLATMGDLRWPIELWAGVTVLSMMLALIVSLIIRDPVSWSVTGGSASTSVVPSRSIDP